MKTKWVLNSLADTQDLAGQLCDHFEDRQILLLEGPMGAGKTQLVRFLVDTLGGEETQSPSFAIHNHYSTPRGPIEHLDLYRLESEEDLESTGFWDLFSQDKALVLIEWADRLNAEYLPPHWSCWRIKMEISGKSQRRVQLLGHKK